MHARTFDSVVLALVLSTLPTWDAWAGGGGHGGGAFRPMGGVRGGFGGHPGFGGGFRAGGVLFGGGRGLPPVSGVIHEGAGGRPYFSAYGHTNTGARLGGFARGGVPVFGRGLAPLTVGGAGSYGHVRTGLRYGAVRRFEGVGAGRRRFAAGRGFVGGFGGGLGYGGYGGYGAPGTYGDAGVYGGQGTYGQAGTYGGQGTYGTQSLYGNGGGVAYRSETPLAARFAEPPLGPSPYAPYSPDDRYAYAASADVGPGLRVVNAYRDAAAGCACGVRREPVVYRYGIGTAY